MIEWRTANLLLLILLLLAGILGVVGWYRYGSLVTERLAFLPVFEGSPTPSPTPATEPTPRVNGARLPERSFPVVEIPSNVKSPFAPVQ